MDITSNNMNQTQLNQNNSYNNTGINNINPNYQGVPQNTSIDNSSYNRNRNNGYDNGYSRHTATDQMINKLEMMMQDATSKDKATIQRCIEELRMDK